MKKHQLIEDRFRLIIKSDINHAFSVLYQEYVDILFNYGNQIIHDPDLVRDCIQEIFIEFWKMTNSYDQISSIKAYLLKSLRNKILTNIKKASKHKEESEKYFLNEYSDEVSSEAIAIQDQTNFEIVNFLKESVNSLTDSQREIVFHIFYHNFQYQEISYIMGISEKTVRNHLSLALNNLREKFDDKYPNTPQLIQYFPFILLLFF